MPSSIESSESSVARGKDMQGSPTSDLDKPLTSCLMKHEGHPGCQYLKHLSHLTIADERSHLIPNLKSRRHK